MTREQLEKMTDRELDAVVAERVMGHRFWLEKRGGYELAVGERVVPNGKNTTVRREPWTGSRGEAESSRYTPVSAIEATRKGFFGEWPASYSTTGDGMLAVIQALGKRGLFPTVEFQEGGGVWVTMWSEASRQWLRIDTHADSADSAPRAVCIAAVLAVEATAQCQPSTHPPAPDSPAANP